VEHLTANGVMEVARLYESPFTDHAPQGPDMIFTDDQVDGIVAILNDVRSRAHPDVVSRVTVEVGIPASNVARPSERAAGLMRSGKRPRWSPVRCALCGQLSSVDIGHLLGALSGTVGRPSPPCPW
jgi:hypothetical protein